MLFNPYHMILGISSNGNGIVDRYKKWTSSRRRIFHNSLEKFSCLRE